MASILVVEDDTDINLLICRNLELVGHSCISCAEGRQARRLMEERSFDLLILDVMLPYLSGFDLMAYRRETPVVFVTAKGRLEDKEISKNTEIVNIGYDFVTNEVVSYYNKTAMEEKQK